MKIPHGIFSSLNLTCRALVLTLREDDISVSIPSSFPVISGVGFNLSYFPAFFFVCTNLLQGNKLALSTGRRYMNTVRDKRAYYWWHSRKHNNLHLCISSFTPRTRRHCQGPRWTLSTQWVHMASEGCWTGGVSPTLLLTLVNTKQDCSWSNAQGDMNVPQVCSVQNQLQEMAQVEESGLCILGTLDKNMQGHSSPMAECLSWHYCGISKTDLCLQPLQESLI